MTARVIKAIEHPSVDIIGHLTARMLLRRDGTKVNVEKVIDAAKANGVALEINSQPHRLDLCDSHARLARDRGVKLIIDSDAHYVEALDYPRWGVLTARRAWVTKDDVINTLPLKKFLARPAPKPLEPKTYLAPMDAIAEIKKLYYAATKGDDREGSRSRDRSAEDAADRGRARARRRLHGRPGADAIGMEAGDARRRRGYFWLATTASGAREPERLRDVPVGRKLLHVGLVEALHHVDATAPPASSSS